MTWQKIVLPLLLIPALAGPGRPLCAAEYFVSLDGDDAADGLSRAAAFRTVQRGVDALAEGDALTVMPGEYFECVFRQGLGGPDRETAIRAEIPGTVLLRGDVPVSGFRPVAGTRFVYAVDFDREVQAVNEVDTLRVLREVPGLAEMEFKVGASYYRPEEKRLYISSTDMLSPDRHRYTVSVLPGHGLYLLEPERVVVEGLAATGFNARVPGSHFPGYQKKWGILLGDSKNCVIRECDAYLNDGGIAFHRLGDTGGNLVERCRAWGNPGGGINGYSSDNDEIRDSRAWRNGYIGVGFYGAGNRGPAILRRNLGWGNDLADVRIKGGEGPRDVESCVGLGNFDVSTHRLSLVGRANAYNPEPGADNILLVAEKDLEPDREFADPLNLDFRLQATSRFRGAGPGGADRGPFPYERNIFYLSTDGLDTNDGLSLDTAWRSLERALGLRFLRPGDTVYLAPGEYEAPTLFRAGEPAGRAIAVRGRGEGRAVIRGPLTIAGSAGVVFERLVFIGPVTVGDSREIAFVNCQFGAGLSARGTAGLRVEHSAFIGVGEPAPASALALADCIGAFLRGNLFDHPAGAPALELDRPGALDYSDYNGYYDLTSAWRVGGPAATPAAPSAPHERYARPTEVEIGPDPIAAQGPLGRDVGPHRDFRVPPVRIEGPLVHSVEDTTANLEWYSSGPVTCEVAWGAAPDAMEARATVSGSGFTSFSITGLEPGREYCFAIVAARAEAGENMLEVATAFRPAPAVFETAAGPAAPAVYYVAPDGDDGSDGRARDRAWLTVARAAAAAGSGDTVLIAGGVYHESVRVRATGQPGRPVSFRALPGEKVVFDGRERLLNRAFILAWKHHIHLDGLYFRQYGDAGWIGVVDLFRSDHARITRCFMNGRGPGYSPRFVCASHSAGLSVENCVITSAFDGFVVRGCPDLRLENNVFLLNWIQAVYIDNNPLQKVFLRRNIITDSLPGKVGVTLLEFARVESLVEEDNCYFLRVPDEERRMFTFYGNFEYERSMRGYGIEVVYPEPPLITELTRMSLAEYRRRFAPGSRSFVGDPKFRAAQGLDAGGFIADRLAGLAELDFPGLFATDPEVVGRGIGLRPEAFADFHFNRR